MRCPAAASRRQGCDVEPQLLELTLLTASDDVDELELVDDEMNSASLVNDTTQPRLSCTANDQIMQICYTVNVIFARCAYNNI